MRILLVLLLVVSGTALHAQRNAGGWAVQAKYGLMEGKGQMNNFFGAFPNGKGTSMSFGLNLLIGNEGAMAEANLFMHDYFVDKNNFDLPYRLYGLNVQGGWSYEGIRKLYLNFKAGGFIGIEDINNGREVEGEYMIPLPHSVNNFVYGISFNPEVEIKIWKKLTGLVGFTQYWNLASKYANWKYSIDLGVKWYL